MSSLIAFDPGNTTGFVIFSAIDFKTRTYEIRSAGTVRWDDRRGIYTLMTQPFIPDWVIIENFLLRRDKAVDQSGSVMPSSRVIERILVYCEQLRMEDRIVMQMPGMRLSARVPTEHESVCRVSHIRAAYLHARYFVLTHKESR